ncbi:alpha-1,2-mannosyltransferase [Coccidioides immitis RS]|uniref:GDP-Man:Man(3)GlcNAc(2)-PP-Dol alpha-1,2-mannosyltransferase n=3 Tax=Coccidioides immitis TaxID=5501 RepID=J3KCM2_COCIM|nr:alpha-1,2-mannosyltransferase [Coccidioides immitis RS]EAS33000.3 alpha-1,2-mannosyltransferase [Coccidioides immitis RS]KMP08276.1 alpha-1,2-mannosyltransferase alg-11 [Coccidioides immitis RMSCC 2394]KMU72464.1 alpha-1,2-mannosyltransferase [Coccidioides immitis RMSCC 3703]TPX19943.1 asparagine-linked glycosylation protein [Coccidioides immitis]
MLAFISSTIATLVSLLALAVIFPTVAGYPIRLVLRGLGCRIKKRTEAKRKLIRARVRVEEEDYQSQRNRQSKAEDADWEKVESYGSQTATDGKVKDSAWDGVVGFFHPFCNAGGGGERVLWAAVRATQKRWPKAICVIYTGDQDVDKATMLKNIERRFNIQLHPPTVVFCYLSTRKYVLSNTYPHFTLLGQSLGSLVLAYDAFTNLVPDVFVDTMGYAFALALSNFLFPSVPTGAYVHYPTISTDMLESLDDKTGQRGLNAGAGTGWKGMVKRKYWHAFAKLYGWVGGTIDVVMCNSSWTSGHIKALWLPSRKNRKQYQEPTVIFPPVAVSDLEGIKIDLASERESREPSILYIAQFRPEKNHALILRSYARFLKQLRIKHSHSDTSTDLPSPCISKPEPKLILIGSVRQSSPDETHIYNLRLLAHELKIRDNTTFICDATWPTVLEHLRHASIGTNAMWNEHFGIGVVEYQAAGLISVVHDSGGPKMDIVIDLEEGATGFRATTEVEYAAAFEAALALPDEEKVAMRMRARKSAQRFTEEEFEKKWLGDMEKLVDLRVQRAGR